VDAVIREPLGGAHWDPARTAKLLKRCIKKYMSELLKLNSEEIVKLRIEKFGRMGVFLER